MTETLKERFVRKANIKHNNKFDYSKVVYVNCKSKVIIICPKHGEFEQVPDSHLQTVNGCKKCGIEVRGNRLKDTTETFIKKAVDIHGAKYNYENVKYIGSSTKVLVTCNIHGDFSIRPNDHLRGKGCKECGIKSRSNKRKLGINEFILLSNSKHNNEFTYNNSIYVNSNTNLLVTCKIHGDFEVTPNNHITKLSGCPTCNESKGERIIRRFLTEHNIEFNPQQRFKNCKYKYRLPFDFYIPQLNLIIEYDGIQHFKPVEQWGGEKYLIEVQTKDAIKDKYCIDNNINIIRIPYTKMDNILEILTEMVLWSGWNSPTFFISESSIWNI